MGAVFCFIIHVPRVKTMKKHIIILCQIGRGFLGDAPRARGQVTLKCNNIQISSLKMFYSSK